MELIFIGTYHYSKKGPKQLKNILNKEQPYIICLEGVKGLKRIFNKYDLEKQLMNKLRQVKGLKIDKYIELMGWHNLKLFYEHDVSLEYAHKNKRLLYYTDDKSIYLKGLKKRYDQLKQIIDMDVNDPDFIELTRLIKQNLKETKNELSEVVKSINEYYKTGEMNDLLVEQLNNNYPFVIGPRDEKMKQVVKTAINQALKKEVINAKIAVINGGLHLVNDLKKRTLYSKLINDRLVKEKVSNIKRLLVGLE